MRRPYLSIGFFVHPVPALAVITLFLNDVYLKSAFSGWWTGKLSDFAGVFFFPLFLVAVYVLLRNTVSKKSNWITRTNILVAIAITDVIFVLINTVPEADLFYETAYRFMGIPARNTMDTTDLIALLVNPLTYRFALSQINEA